MSLVEAVQVVAVIIAVLLGVTAMLALTARLFRGQVEPIDPEPLALDDGCCRCPVPGERIEVDTRDPLTGERMVLRTVCGECWQEAWPVYGWQADGMGIDRNLRALRAEERAAPSIRRPAGFVAVGPRGSGWDDSHEHEYVEVKAWDGQAVRRYRTCCSG